MQLAYRHDERPGESYEALDGKKILVFHFPKPLHIGTEGVFKIAKALQMHLSHSSVALSASDPVCGGALLISGVPSARRNTLSGN